MLRLALPVVVAEIGWMAMGVVDTIMVAPLGPAAIGSAGAGSSMHFAFAVFGMGLLLGLDTLVSQAFGASKRAECDRWLVHGVALSVLLMPIMVLVCLGVLLAIPHLGFHPEVKPLLRTYFAIVMWSTPFLLFYAAFRRYLQGMHLAVPVMVALITANIVNASANWVLIYGHLGFPPLGVAGAAWATLVSRLYMASVLLAVIVWLHRDRILWGRALPLSRVVTTIERDSLWRLVQLGFPAAAQITLEVGVFAAAAMFANMLTPVAAASHQISLNIIAVAFMVPLGLSSAGAVRVGHAIGADDPRRAAAAGWTAIALTVAFMSAAAVAFVAIPRTLIGWFTHDPSVLALGSTLLLVAAIFQLFDGMQGVTTGVLRGLGDTRTPMITNLAGHWVFGLPAGYSLCFLAGLGVIGLWIGLSIGLIFAGVVLLWVWMRRIAAIQEDRYREARGLEITATHEALGAARHAPGTAHAAPRTGTAHPAPRTGTAHAAPGTVHPAPAPSAPWHPGTSAPES